MKVAIYCRVSTDAQEREGSSLETQLWACLKYCQEKGYDVTYRFSETYSGLSLDRPELAKLRELVRSQKIEIVVVYCLDRLSRDPVHGVIITQELDKYGIILEAVTETVENSDLGRLISYVKGFSAKLEAQKIAERTKRGKDHLVSRGLLPIGTGKGLYGYSWNKVTKKREPIEFEVKVVEKIFTMLADGDSRHKIAQSLNAQGIRTKGAGKWHPVMIQNMATHTAYIGITYFYRNTGSRKTSLVKQPQSKWVTLPDVTPPIISKELFERAQNQLMKSKEARQNTDTRHYLLRGHVYCGICGTSLTGTCQNRHYLYYHCRATLPTITKAKSCNARCIKASLLETIVWDKVKQLLSHPETVIAEIKKQAVALRLQSGNGTLEKDIKKLQLLQKDYDNQEKRLVNALRSGTFTEDCVLDSMNQLKNDRQSTSHSLTELISLKGQLATLEKAEIKITNLQPFIQRIEQFSDDEKRLAFEALDIKVRATTDKIEINSVIPVSLASTLTSSTTTDVTCDLTVIPMFVQW